MDNKYINGESLLSIAYSDFLDFSLPLTAYMSNDTPKGFSEIIKDFLVINKDDLIECLKEYGMREFKRGYEARDIENAEK